jgi:hypothetical protein
MQHSKRGLCTLSPKIFQWVFVEFWDMCISRQEGQEGVLRNQFGHRRSMWPSNRNPNFTLYIEEDTTICLTSKQNR